MKPGTSFFWRLYQLFFCFTLLVYAFSYFAFTGHWAVGFLMMSLPILPIVHAILLVFFAPLSIAKSLAVSLSIITEFSILGKNMENATFDATFGNNPQRDFSDEL
jgi:hypothetical protein